MTGAAVPIAWNVNAGRVDVVFSDPYDIAEAERTMKEIYGTPGIGRPLRMLVDVRRSAPPDTEFVVNAINFWQLHVSEMWGARVAVIAASMAQVDMGEMSQRSAESRELPFSVRTFVESEQAEAERWLHEG